MPAPRVFLDRFRDPSPALRAQFVAGSSEKPTRVRVEHRLGARPPKGSAAALAGTRRYAAARELLAFYGRYDGAAICATFDARYDETRPMLELLPAERIAEFTGRYGPDGDLGWTIDYNKSKRIYRGASPWIAFAEIDSGPMCLTMFLRGEHAGQVFYVAPQPRFNNLRPIAKGFFALLERVGRDPAAFMRLVRATVTLRGKDGDNYGLVPIDYAPGRPPRPRKSSS
jgi:hypothetical protein